MGVVIGVGGAQRNAAAALCHDGRVLGFSEEERLTRVKGVGLALGGLPDKALEYLRSLGAAPNGDETLATAEPGVQLPASGVRVDHHAGHAATAFASSPFERAAVLVCDSDPACAVSLWIADATGVAKTDFHWHGPGFATLYSWATEAFGFVPHYGEHRIEGLARLGDIAQPTAWPDLFTFHGDHIELRGDVRSRLSAALGASDDIREKSRVAARLQSAIGLAVLQLVETASATLNVADLCLTGGLFYNSYFTTLVARSAAFARVSVPVNPGNAGTAIGAALLADGSVPAGRGLSPFLGPQFGAEHVKSVLDNCKLSYEYLSDGPLIESTAAALKSGRLVGWFNGRMEWGIRALGNRSILANPFSRYTLENLNHFLKRREVTRPYAVSILTDALDEHFEGPRSSPIMEYEYSVRDPQRFRGMLPGVGRTLRVHTVADKQSSFGQLLRAFGTQSDAPALVNTSFNGFHEPIVCSPRDAVRVFYGTGLDLAVIGNFVIRK